MKFTPHYEQMTEDSMCPPRFVAAEKGDVRKAIARWKRTLEWRAEYHVDGLLDEPQEHFEVIKQAYPHAFHKRSRAGHVVVYQSLGQIDWAMLEQAGVGLDQLIRHFLFTQEFLWKELETDDEKGRCVTVLDVGGVKKAASNNTTTVGVRPRGSGSGLSSSGSSHNKGMDFLKAMLVILGEHYPQRAHSICLVNVPWGFSTLWGVVARFVDPTTREKIRIERGATQVKLALLSLVPDTHIPLEYGGGNGVGEVAKVLANGNSNSSSSDTGGGGGSDTGGGGSGSGGGSGGSGPWLWGAKKEKAVVKLSTGKAPPPRKSAPARLGRQEVVSTAAVERAESGGDVVYAATVVASGIEAGDGEDAATGATHDVDQQPSPRPTDDVYALIGLAMASASGASALGSAEDEVKLRERALKTLQNLPLDPTIHRGFSGVAPDDEVAAAAAAAAAASGGGEGGGDAAVREEVGGGLGGSKDRAKEGNAKDNRDIIRNEPSGAPPVWHAPLPVPVPLSLPSSSSSAGNSDAITSAPAPPQPPHSSQLEAGKGPKEFDKETETAHEQEKGRKERVGGAVNKGAVRVKGSAPRWNSTGGGTMGKPKATATSTSQASRAQWASGGSGSLSSGSDPASGSRESTTSTVEARHRGHQGSGESSTSTVVASHQPGGGGRESRRSRESSKGVQDGATSKPGDKMNSSSRPRPLPLSQSSQRRTKSTGNVVGSDRSEKGRGAVVSPSPRLGSHVTPPRLASPAGKGSAGGGGGHSNRPQPSSRRSPRPEQQKQEQQGKVEEEKEPFRRRLSLSDHSDSLASMNEDRNAELVGRSSTEDVVKLYALHKTIVATQDNDGGSGSGNGSKFAGSSGGQPLVRRQTTVDDAASVSAASSGAAAAQASSKAPSPPTPGGGRHSSPGTPIGGKGGGGDGLVGGGGGDESGLSLKRRLPLPFSSLSLTRQAPPSTAAPTPQSSPSHSLAGDSPYLSGSRFFPTDSFDRKGEPNAANQGGSGSGEGNGGLVSPEVNSHRVSKDSEATTRSPADSATPSPAKNADDPSSEEEQRRSESSVEQKLRSESTAVGGSFELSALMDAQAAMLMLREEEGADSESKQGGGSDNDNAEGCDGDGDDGDDDTIVFMSHRPSGEKSLHRKGAAELVRSVSMALLEEGVPLGSVVDRHAILVKTKEDNRAAAASSEGGGAGKVVDEDDEDEVLSALSMSCFMEALDEEEEGEEEQGGGGVGGLWAANTRGVNTAAPKDSGSRGVKTTATTRRVQGARGHLLKRDSCLDGGGAETKESSIYHELFSEEVDNEDKPAKTQVSGPVGFMRSLIFMRHKGREPPSTAALEPPGGPTRADHRNISGFTARTTGLGRASSAAPSLRAKSNRRVQTTESVINSGGGGGGGRGGGTGRTGSRVSASRVSGKRVKSSPAASASTASASIPKPARTRATSRLNTARASTRSLSSSTSLTGGSTLPPRQRAKSASSVLSSSLVEEEPPPLAKIVSNDSFGSGNNNTEGSKGSNNSSGGGSRKPMPSRRRTKEVGSGAVTAVGGGKPAAGRFPKGSRQKTAPT